MKIDIKDFRVREQLKKTLSHCVAETSDLQSLLYASNRYAILLIFQAMDAAGKARSSM